MSLESHFVTSPGSENSQVTGLRETLPERKEFFIKNFAPLKNFEIFLRKKY